MDYEKSGSNTLYVFLGGLLVGLVVNVLLLIYTSSEMVRMQAETDKSINRLEGNVSNLESKVDLLPFRVTTALEAPSEELKKQILVAK